MKRKEIRQKKKIKRSKKVYFVRFMSLFVILVVAVSAVIYVQAEKTLTKTHVNTKIKSSSISAKKPLTILLMGVDTGDNSRGGCRFMEWKFRFSNYFNIESSDKNNHYYFSGTRYDDEY
ncbi:hypothetical protein [Lactococcus lactis]|uniref:hypothetical protein n=1 Tax=Lactococcus lactis TaxID=1358 RepID=UPI00315DBFFA